VWVGVSGRALMFSWGSWACEKKGGGAGARRDLERRACPVFFRRRPAGDVPPASPRAPWGQILHRLKHRLGRAGRAARWIGGQWRGVRGCGEGRALQTPSAPFSGAFHQLPRPWSSPSRRTVSANNGRKGKKDEIEGHEQAHGGYSEGRGGRGVEGE
jgi:hypothetical protein